MDQDRGLVMIFDDGKRIELTVDRVQELVDRWVGDADMIPPRVKAFDEFQPCAICPLSGSRAFCHALHPLLPLAEHQMGCALDTELTVVLQDEGGQPAQTRRTTVRGAMENVALLSLTQYCETGKTYARLYRGAGPMMGVEEFAGHVARNLRAEAQGNPVEMRRKAEEFSHDLKTTSRGQIGRLRLLSKQEPLVNAVVNALILLECLVEEQTEAILSGAFAPCV